MIQVGLVNIYKENLLLSKVNVFAYLNRVLFGRALPSLLGFGAAGALVATPCAADDLDIFNSYANEQIEFQDFKNPDNQLLHSNLTATYGENTGVAAAHQHYQVYPTQQQNQQQMQQMQQNQAHAQLQVQVQAQAQAQTQAHAQSQSQSQLVGGAIPIPQQNHQNHQIHYVEPFANVSVSHFNLNMNHSDFVNDQYFQDFKSFDPKDSADYQSMYGSSSESYVSPLDDEFFKKFTPDASNMSSNTEFDSRNVEFENMTSSSKKRSYESSETSKNGQVVPQSSSEANPVNFYDVNTIFNDYLMENSNNQSNAPVRIKQENEMFPRVPSRQHSHSQSQTHSHSHGHPQFGSAPQPQVIQRHESVVSTTSSCSISSENLNTNMLNNKKIKIEADQEAKFKCSFCDAKFKVKGYLTRHLKKHNSSKAFVCPFYQESPTKQCNPSKKNVIAGTKCHPTGGFSRRDTYKTHLKALHFIYPPGTKSNERNSIGGNCAGCFVFFENNIKWLEDHIEKGLCTKIVKDPEM